MAFSIKEVLSSTCLVTVPSPNSVLKDVLPRRWMQYSTSSLPSAVVTPSTEDDIIAVVKYARANNLRVLPSGGGCAGFVVVNTKTIYLHMEKFNGVKVDTKHHRVIVGGGARWSDVIGRVVSEGYYTGTLTLTVQLLGFNFS